MSSLFSLKSLIATLICLILLIIGASLTYYLLNSQKNNDLTIIPVTKERVSLVLSLSSPDDNLLVFEPDLLIQGKTTPQAVVLLSSQNQDLLLNLTTNGDFSQTLKLQEGVNRLIVASVDKLGNNKKEVRTIYYSKEKI